MSERAEVDATAPLDEVIAWLENEVREAEGDMPKHSDDPADLAWCENRARQARGALAALSGRAAQSEPARLRAVIERGRSEVASGVHGVKAAVHAFGWLAEGRGSYEWDDDRYREEFGRAMDAVLEAIKPLETLARDWTDCPATQAEVDAARARPLIGTPKGVKLIEGRYRVVCYTDEQQCEFPRCAARGESPCAERKARADKLNGVGTPGDSERLPKHDVRVRSFLDIADVLCFHAYCSCGWAHESRRIEQERALRDAAEHERAAGVGTPEGDEIEYTLLERAPLDACINENGNIAVRWMGWWGIGDTIAEAMTEALRKYEAKRELGPYAIIHAEPVAPEEEPNG